ncbi:hypothetical protein NT6N_14510 [Oceaniferula spumae]|uniref:GAF domain-containing protein n=1 Tax=Oceaniferula spumae TaxID=2979115 RepID=UPI003A681BEF
MPPEIDDATSSLLLEVLRRCCGVVHCTDSALWLADTDHLHPVIGFGPHSETFIGSYSHPLEEGLMSMVYASGQPFCENNIQSNPQHSSRLDQQLSIQTDAMMVVPVVSKGELAGVITCVHTSAVGASTNEARVFSSQDMSELEFTAAVAGRILETSV